jgi:hypothetical protein
VQKLIGIRKANSALYRGDYAEMWRHNGDPRPNVYAFFRGDGASRVIIALNNGDRPSGIARVSVNDNAGIAARDRVALADGTVLVDLLGDGAPSPVTLSDGHLALSLPGKAAGIYRPRSRLGASAVTFRIRARTDLGESLYLSGNTSELGSWEPLQAVRLRPADCVGAECTWSLTLRYLPYGRSLRFKFLRKSDTAMVWETGTDRTFDVPGAATATYDGQRWRD